VDAVIGGVGILRGGLEVTVLGLVLLVLSDELVDAVIEGVGIPRGGLEVTVLALVLLLHVTTVIASLTVVAAHSITGVVLGDKLEDAIMGASASSEEASRSPYSYSFFSSMLPASSPTASPAPRRSVMT
jgi:hypothetical protein